MSDKISVNGLPMSPDTERLILGCVLLNESHYVSVAAKLQPDDFALDKHRRIFAQMTELYEDNEHIDRITVARRLMDKRELEACGGLSYLVGLDEGLPELFNIESYIRIVKDKATRRKGIYACQNIMNRFMLETDETPQILAGGNEAFLRLGEEQIKSGLSTPEQIITEFPGGLNSFLDPSKRAKGVATGLAKFDEMTGGLQEEDLIILAGRPSMGKSALAQTIAQHVTLKLEKPVAIFSLEMSAGSVLERVICASARVDLHKFRSGYINSEERHRLQVAAGKVSQAPLLIDGSAGLTLMDVHAKLKQAESEYGYHFALVVIDYLQLMTSRAKAENRNLEITTISRGLKLLAKELKVPVLALSQLSRGPETRSGDHRPLLSDLRESGSIEQDADLVAFVFREEVYRREREDLQGLAELIIAKQRNGPTGKVDLVFLKHLTKFENRAEDLGEAPPMYRTAGTGELLQ